MQYTFFNQWNPCYPSWKYIINKKTLFANVKNKVYYLGQISPKNGAQTLFLLYFWHQYTSPNISQLYHNTLLFNKILNYKKKVCTFFWAFLEGANINKLRSNFRAPLSHLRPIFILYAEQYALLFFHYMVSRFTSLI